MPQHPSHKTQVPRINRAIGQLEAIKRMIDEKKHCADIMSQLRASRNAVKAIELGVLETHMKARVMQAYRSKNEKYKAQYIGEIVELLKKYE